MKADLKIITPEGEGEALQDKRDGIEIWEVNIPEGSFIIARQDFEKVKRLRQAIVDRYGYRQDQIVTEYRSGPTYYTIDNWQSRRRLRDDTRSRLFASEQEPVLMRQRIPAQPYNGRPPFVRGSDTSEAAANSIAETTGSIRSRIYGHIQRRGRAGATDDEIEQYFGLRHQTASARRRELVLKGRIIDSGQRRRTRSGRHATVWIDNNEGDAN